MAVRAGSLMLVDSSASRSSSPPPPTSPQAFMWPLIRWIRAACVWFDYGKRSLAMRQILSSISSASGLMAILCALDLQVAAMAKPSGDMQKATQQQEVTFTQLEVPPPFTYQEGTVTRTTSGGRRFIQFIGTTAMPPYFSCIKDSDAFARSGWQKQLLLSKAWWIFKYEDDCDSLIFNRNVDQVYWKDIYLDPASYAAYGLFCPQASWGKLSTI